MSRGTLNRYCGSCTTFRNVLEPSRYRLNVQSPLDVNSDGRQRTYGTATAATDTWQEPNSTGKASVDGRAPYSQRAKQKQIDKEFFADLLSSAATKRDAKTYLSRLTQPTVTRAKTGVSHRPGVQVNLGNLFGRSRAVEGSPVFTQDTIQEQGFDKLETLHVALVKLSNISGLSETVLQGIAQTLSQLCRLSMSPCIVVSIDTAYQDGVRKQLLADAERLAKELNRLHENGASIVENLFSVTEAGDVQISLPKMLQSPLGQGKIPIIIPAAFSVLHQTIESIPANEAIIAIVKRFYEPPTPGKTSDADISSSTTPPNTHRRVSLDRIIVIDQAGGIPSETSTDGKHVFLNLEQEFETVRAQLVESETNVSAMHISNLAMLRDVLRLLPQASSGLMTTPTEASNLDQLKQTQLGLTVGTRRQKNALIHNLLTDKPAYSASLPQAKLSKIRQNRPSEIGSTFVKLGMPVKILPDPWEQSWKFNGSRIKLTDPAIDLDRLVYLVNDSFNRKLDVDGYLARVNDNLAGVIIAGDYEGGAILTWESPPGADPDDPSHRVPYLDKFAVLKKSQGSGGVADIVFNAMVRTCFPHGVCWRSRKNNPVNKWYFERSSGTWKIPDMNWTMFWTTPGLTQRAKAFEDYEGVCRSVQPTWLDKTKPAD